MRLIEQKKCKRKYLNTVYCLVLSCCLFSCVCFSLTGFIGSPQHTISHDSQPQGSSTNTTSPQSSHLYFSPFFLTILYPPKFFLSKLKQKSALALTILLCSSYYL